MLLNQARTGWSGASLRIQNTDTGLDDTVILPDDRAALSFPLRYETDQFKYLKVSYIPSPNAALDAFNDFIIQRVETSPPVVVFQRGSPPLDPLDTFPDGIQCTELSQGCTGHVCQANARCIPNFKNQPQCICELGFYECPDCVDNTCLPGCIFNWQLPLAPLGYNYLVTVTDGNGAEYATTHNDTLPLPTTEIVPAGGSINFDVNYTANLGLIVEVLRDGQITDKVLAGVRIDDTGLFQPFPKEYSDWGDPMPVACFACPAKGECNVGPNSGDCASCLGSVCSSCNRFDALLSDYTCGQSFSCEGSPCHEFATCVHQDTCSCNFGYTGDGSLYGAGCHPVCPDCSSQAECTGPNECKCKPGFAGDATASGSGCVWQAFVCGEAVCHPDAECKDVEGNGEYACICPSGFIGAGLLDGSGCSPSCPSSPCHDLATCLGNDVCECTQGYYGDGLQDGVGCRPFNARCTDDQGADARLSVKAGDSVFQNVTYGIEPFNLTGLPGENQLCPYTDNKGLLYSFVPDTSGVAVIDCCSALTDYDTSIYAYTGDCQNLENLWCEAANDDGPTHISLMPSDFNACQNAPSGEPCGLASILEMDVSAGVDYTIFIGGSANALQGYDWGAHSCTFRLDKCLEDTKPTDGVSSSSLNACRDQVYCEKITCKSGYVPVNDGVLECVDGAWSGGCKPAETFGQESFRMALSTSSIQCDSSDQESCSSANVCDSFIPADGWSSDEVCEFDVNSLGQEGCRYHINLQNSDANPCPNCDPPVAPYTWNGADLCWRQDDQLYLMDAVYATGCRNRQTIDQRFAETGEAYILKDRALEIEYSSNVDLQVGDATNFYTVEHIKPLFYPEVAEEVYRSTQPPSDVISVPCCCVGWKPGSAVPANLASILGVTPPSDHTSLSTSSSSSTVASALSTASQSSAGADEGGFLWVSNVMFTPSGGTSVLGSGSTSALKTPAFSISSASSPSVQHPESDQRISFWYWTTGVAGERIEIEVLDSAGQVIQVMDFPTVELNPGSAGYYNLGLDGYRIDSGASLAPAYNTPYKMNGFGSGLYGQRLAEDMSSGVDWRQLVVPFDSLGLRDGTEISVRLNLVGGSFLAVDDFDFGGGECGNNVVEANEECDDGNTVAADSCSNHCKRNAGCAAPELSPSQVSTMDADLQSCYSDGSCADRLPCLYSNASNGDVCSWNCSTVPEDPLSTTQYSVVCMDGEWLAHQCARGCDEPPDLSASAFLLSQDSLLQCGGRRHGFVCPLVQCWTFFSGTGVAQCTDGTWQLPECVFTGQEGASAFYNQDLEFLVYLYAQTAGPGWLAADHWLEPGVSFCTWHGITCTDGSLIEVSLGANNLVGQLPVDQMNTNAQEGGSLDVYLEKFDVSRNSISGSIFDLQVDRMKNLQFLDISHNLLSGQLPPSLASGTFSTGNEEAIVNLVVLNVSSNFFDDTVPTLALFSNIEYANMSNNKLSGGIQVLGSSVLDLRLLKELDISHNEITGTLPLDGFSGTLELFDFSYNQIEGPLPQALLVQNPLWYLGAGHNLLGDDVFNWADECAPTAENLANRMYCSLQHVDLSNNNINVDLSLHGPKWSLYEGLDDPEQLTPGLLHLDLSDNFIHGPIPEDMNVLENLRLIDLDNNRFTSHIPASFDATAFPAMETFHIGGLNHDSSSGGSVGLPTTVASMITLKSLNMSHDAISGSIPEVFYNLANLELLDLSGNIIGGTLPSYITGWRSMRQLDLGSNQFSGTLPDQISSMALLTHLHLQDNLLSGAIPLALFWLDLLQELKLYDNQLAGTIPDAPAPMHMLEVLDMHNNLLSGTMPSFEGMKRLQYLDVSVNQLEGTLPYDLALLPELEYMSFSRNRFHGALEPSFGSLPVLSKFEAWKNNLDGTIPVSFWTSSTLQKLDLRSNSLTGLLGTDLALLTSMQELRLSANQLEGTIPEQIGKITGLVNLDLAQNNFSGAIPDTMWDLVSLSSLYLAGNTLTGTLSPRVELLQGLTDLRLGNNSLSGELPGTALVRMQGLVQLRAGNNQFSGTIPHNLGLMTNLLILDISNNNLGPDIPDTLGHENLEALLLAGNDLTGDLNTVLERETFWGTHLYDLFVLTLGQGLDTGNPWKCPIPQSYTWLDFTDTDCRMQAAIETTGGTVEYVKLSNAQGMVFLTVAVTLYTEQNISSSSNQFVPDKAFTLELYEEGDNPPSLGLSMEVVATDPDRDYSDIPAAQSRSGATCRSQDTCLHRVCTICSEYVSAVTTVTLAFNPAESPTDGVGNYSFNIGLNSQDLQHFFSAELPFPQFQVDAIVEALSVDDSSSVSQNGISQGLMLQPSNVTIRGSGFVRFQRQPAAACRFWLNSDIYVTSQIQYVDSTRVTCTQPTIPESTGLPPSTEGQSFISVSVDGKHWDGSTEKTPYNILGPPHKVQLDEGTLSVCSGADGCAADSPDFPQSITLQTVDAAGKVLLDQDPFVHTADVAVFFEPGGRSPCQSKCDLVPEAEDVVQVVSVTNGTGQVPLSSVSQRLVGCYTICVLSAKSTDNTTLLLPDNGNTFLVTAGAAQALYFVPLNTPTTEGWVRTPELESDDNGFFPLNFEDTSVILHVRDIYGNVVTTEEGNYDITTTDHSYDSGFADPPIFKSTVGVEAGRQIGSQVINDVDFNDGVLVIQPAQVRMHVPAGVSSFCLQFSVSMTLQIKWPEGCGSEADVLPLQVIDCPPSLESSLADAGSVLSVAVHPSESFIEQETIISIDQWLQTRYNDTWFEQLSLTMGAGDSLAMPPDSYRRVSICSIQIRILFQESGAYGIAVAQRNKMNVAVRPSSALSTPLHVASKSLVSAHMDGTVPSLFTDSNNVPPNVSILPAELHPSSQMFSSGGPSLSEVLQMNATGPDLCVPPSSVHTAHTEQLLAPPQLVPAAFKAPQFPVKQFVSKVKNLESGNILPLVTVSQHSLGATSFLMHYNSLDGVTTVDGAASFAILGSPSMITGTSVTSAHCLTSSCSCSTCSSTLCCIDSNTTAALDTLIISVVDAAKGALEPYWQSQGLTETSILLTQVKFTQMTDLGGVVDAPELVYHPEVRVQNRN